MKLRSRFALRSIALGLAAAGLIAAGSPAEADDKVSLRLKWLNQAQFAGYYVAKEKGFYKDERLDVTINPGGPQIVAENLVASGADDFAHGGGLETAMTAREKGLPIVVLAPLFQKTPFLLVTGAIYLASLLLLARRYFFSIPFFAVSACLALYLAGTLLALR